MTRSTWPLIALALLGACAAVFCLAAFDWMDGACRLPAGEDGKILTKNAWGCFEFWLNRYQTLLSAGVAVGAAWYAGHWVKRQIILGRKQLAAANLPSIEQGVERAELTLATTLEFWAITVENNVDIWTIISVAQMDPETAASMSGTSRIQIAKDAIVRLQSRIEKAADRLTAINHHAGLSRLPAEYRPLIMSVFDELRSDFAKQKSLIETFGSALSMENLEAIPFLAKTLAKDEDLVKYIFSTRQYPAEKLHDIHLKLLNMVDEYKKIAYFSP